MAFEATFKHGDPQMADYTPGSAVAAGQVIQFGTAGLTCGVAHVAIAANALGAIAVGGGIYEAINHDNAANWAKVYWNDTSNYLTTTSTSNALFGYIVNGGAGGADSLCRVLHQPYV